ncbi:LysR substrate-binding domain-containing protein [Vibrio scophthalmi]|uniref:LysR substrate-binding domain-containing protein n=1 Tax=Vibrio scophthalmi TaxID=45658 RepID=UPI00349FA744
MCIYLKFMIFIKIIRGFLRAKHGFYASPEYLAKVPKINDLRALTGQSWVSVDHVVDLPVYQGESLIEVMTIKPKLVVNDIIAVMAAVEKGLGVASLPSRYVTPSDNLVQILPQYHRSARQAYLVYKQRRYQPKALSLFIEALMEGVSALKSLNHAS